MPDLSRLQAGKLHIRPEPCHLSEMISITSAQLKAVTEQHRLIIKIPPDVPPVLADSQRIAEVLVNLVSNAAKYTPTTFEITISASIQAANVQVNVSDQGLEIPLENRECVFEAFLQLERPLEQQGTGLGLGLAICKGLIDAHGGNIWIADTTIGATMSFTLPITKPQ